MSNMSPSSKIFFIAFLTTVLAVNAFSQHSQSVSQSVTFSVHRLNRSLAVQNVGTWLGQETSQRYKFSVSQFDNSLHVTIPPQAEGTDQSLNSLTLSAAAQRMNQLTIAKFPIETRKVVVTVTD